jgi:hypothetical protein
MKCTNEDMNFEAIPFAKREGSAHSKSSIIYEFADNYQPLNKVN